MDSTTSPLLFEANVGLIPDDVVDAFTLQFLRQKDAINQVKTVLAVAVAWWGFQASSMQEFHPDAAGGHFVSLTPCRRCDLLVEKVCLAAAC